MGDDASAADNDETAPLYIGTWIVLSLIAAISFWVQASVTEERFVPALNVISNVFRIPDDIAGATLMAAGASSPELFSSFTALFVTHSSLGLGTIVGSEVFNQLLITAGSVYASPSSGLQLDPIIVGREVGFYGLSILLLYISLQDTRPIEEGGENHIFISFWKACMVFSGYILYVIVCANMKPIIQFCSKFKLLGKTVESSIDAAYGVIETLPQKTGSRVDLRQFNQPQLKLAYFHESSLLKTEPLHNFEKVSLYRTTTGERYYNDHVSRDSVVTESSDQPERSRSFELEHQPASSLEEDTALDRARSFGIFSDGKSLRKVEFLQTTKPSKIHGLYEMETNPMDGSFSCFLYQRSSFYDKARMAIHGWHLRWFTFSNGDMESVPDRKNAANHKIFYPKFRSIEVDDQRLIIRILNPVPGRRNYYLLAPSKEILDAVVSRMETIMEQNVESDASGAAESVGQDPNVPHASLIEFPSGSSMLSIVCFCALFPFRLLMHVSVPDVRLLDTHGNPVPKVSTAVWAILMCLLWLIVGSFAMVASLENLADLMDIPAAVVGVTVSAAGTSLPNYVASRIAARKGFGNMAVSNAFGSNTFNIMIGLGLPWILYTSFGTGFQPYSGLKDEGITESVLILASVLLVFVVVVLSSGFVIYRWHAAMFIVLYVAYVAYEVIRVYL